MSTMRRRSAKKSRHGCRECKRRHVKCDETKPSCVNCNIHHLQCSFLSPYSLPIPRTAPAAVLYPKSPTSGSSPPDDIVQYTGIVTPSSTHDTPELSTPLFHDGPTFTNGSLVSTDQTFKLHHLELLHNYRTGVLDYRILDDATADGFYAMTIRTAVQAPYLMDQLLAVSAANMSTQRPNQRRFYLEEATHLQTRALALFNAAQVTEATGNGLPGFLFSTLLSQQVLFDAFSIRADFPTFLDNLVTGFRLCSGVRTIIGDSWNSILTQYRQQAGINLPGNFLADYGAETVLTTKLTHLKSLLEDASLSPSVSSPCIEALDFLRNMSYASDHPKFSAFRTTRVFRWAVLVPSDFVNLLEQRRPEALIITAYYAVLVHDSRGYWLFGDAGAFIIRSITKFLGKYWAEWLAWPNEELDSVGCMNEVLDAV
ncbi:hypothetical protein HD806DRAFT_510656 [Xylariaceae sp. AK1471]|nr:hypothetical protein HD806DRAFT_510656 [Xylariaceae sp. AK1471]